MAQPLHGPQPPSRDPESILILKPSSLGDIVHTLPAAAALKRRFPSSRIRWLANPEWAPLLHSNPAVDEVLIFPRQNFRGPLGPLRLLRWARTFASKGASPLVLDFQGLLRSGLIGRLCRLSRFYGLSDAREGAGLFYDAAACVHRGQHAVDRYLALARSVGVPADAPLEWPAPQCSPPAAFCADTPFVALHPFSRGAGKSLSPAQLEALCEALAPLRVVLVGRSQTPVRAFAHVENWLNQTTLLELWAVLRAATWTLSVDSGPMHMAAALSPRLVAIHTWSDPQRVGPYPGDAWVWQNGRLFQRLHPADALAISDCSALGAWVKMQRALYIPQHSPSNPA